MIEVRQPVVKDTIFEELEKNLNDIFFKILWEPILSVLKKYELDTKIDNALTTGEVAIINGMKANKIFMKRNKESVTFTGKFDAQMSKEFKKMGGEYNRKKKSWNVPYKNLPQQINATQGQIDVQNEQMQREMIKAMPSLDQIKELVEQNDEWIEENMHKAIEEMNSDWKTASRKLAVMPDFTDEQVIDMAHEYALNLKRNVVGFSDVQVFKLREMMEESISTGARADTLVKDLQAKFSISENKAKFLAKQETRLLTTQYLHERASVAGCKKFRWSTSHDSRVREQHRKYDGKIFEVMEAGNLGNPDSSKVPSGVLNIVCKSQDGDITELPGQPFGCRCRAIYLFE